MWTDVVAWLGSAAGMRVIDGAVVPAVAILVAGLLAAWIARRALHATAARLDRAMIAEAVAAAVGAVQASAPSDERVRVRRAETDVRLRMLPVPGAAVAADWVGAALARQDAGDSAAPSAVEVRDRLLAWAAHPRRANALFSAQHRPKSAAADAAATKAPVSSAGPVPDAAPVSEAVMSGRAVDEPESGPLTEPVVLQREPDPALIAAVQREMTAGGDAHARHARSPKQPPVAERATHHTGPLHRDGPDRAEDQDVDDDDEVVADAPSEEAPDPVLVSSLGDRRFTGESLVPDGAVPVPRTGHRANR